MFLYTYDLNTEDVYSLGFFFIKDFLSVSIICKHIFLTYAIDLFKNFAMKPYVMKIASVLEGDLSLNLRNSLLILP